tara:strand:- start:49 stop:480 length:432 start_codon:yes stop_codon:yes gene_type:complete
MNLNPKIWGPYYWFVLYTIAISYPTSPNDVTKKKYYDFIQNFPLFLPSSDIGNTFTIFIDKYPVTPYLDTRESFIKWVHFIHNKINIYLGKNEISYYEAMKLYYKHYEEKTIKVTNEKKHKHKYIFASIIFILILTIIIMYKL